MCWVTQHQLEVAKCEKFSHIHLVHSLFGNTKWPVLTQQSMVSFQLISMLSYAKNKQQMCWVTQHQCRSRQMWKIFTNSPSTLTFCLLQKKWLFLHEQSIHGNAFNSLGSPLLLRTNYRCVESLNISVEVAKCGKFSSNSPSTLTFCLLQKWLVLPEKSIHGKVSTHKDVLLC